MKSIGDRMKRYELSSHLYLTRRIRDYIEKLLLTKEGLCQD